MGLCEIKKDFFNQTGLVDVKYETVFNRFGEILGKLSQMTIKVTPSIDEALGGFLSGNLPEFALTYGGVTYDRETYKDDPFVYFVVTKKLVVFLLMRTSGLGINNPTDIFSDVIKNIILSNKPISKSIQDKFKYFYDAESVEDMDVSEALTVLRDYEDTINSFKERRDSLINLGQKLSEEVSHLKIAQANYVDNRRKLDNLVRAEVDCTNIIKESQEKLDKISQGLLLVTDALDNKNYEDDAEKKELLSAKENFIAHQDSTKATIQEIEKKLNSDFSEIKTLKEFLAKAEDSDNIIKQNSEQLDAIKSELRGVENSLLETTVDRDDYAGKIKIRSEEGGDSVVYNFSKDLTSWQLDKCEVLVWVYVVNYFNFYLTLHPYNLVITDIFGI